MCKNKNRFFIKRLPYFFLFKQIIITQKLSRDTGDIFEYPWAWDFNFFMTCSLDKKYYETLIVNKLQPLYLIDTQTEINLPFVNTTKGSHNPS